MASHVAPLEFCRDPQDHGRWAYLRKPWEKLPMTRRYWLVGVGHGLIDSWDEGMWPMRPDSADSAGARSWVQGDGSFVFGMLTYARLCAIH